jgi:DNA-binding transcriptional ArsR family regulator
MQGDPELRRTLWFLLGGKRGGQNRARIIWSLRDKPSNINQLATELDLQYKALQHHIRILVGSNLLAPSGEGYGAVYLLSQWFEHHFEDFEQICRKLGYGPSPAGSERSASESGRSSALVRTSDAPPGTSV